MPRPARSIRHLTLVFGALLASACGGNDPVVEPDVDQTDVGDTSESDAVDGDAVDGDADIDALLDTADAPDAGDTADATDTSDAGNLPQCEFAGESTTVEETIGAWTFTIDEFDGAWTAQHDETSATVSGPAACSVDGADHAIRGLRGEPRVRSEFGAFIINLFGPDAIWLAPYAAPTIERQGDAIRLTYALIGQTLDTSELATPGVLVLEPVGDQLSVSVEGDFLGGEISVLSDEQTGVFGLGTQVTSLNLAGRTYPLWTQEQGISKPENGGVWPLTGAPETAYAPMGIWHTTEGYSAIVATDVYSELDVMETFTDRISLRSYATPPSYRVLTGTPRERVTQVSDFTGRVDEVPDWVFAPWNDAVGGPDHLLEVAAALRDNDIPSSAIWTEDWIGGEQTSNGYRLTYAWAWDDTYYPDLPANIEDLHGRGFAFLGYFNPFVPAPTAMWAEGEPLGYLVQTDEGETYVLSDPAFRDAGLVDLTNPAARNWLVGYLTTAADDLGIDGWMADFAEWLPTNAAMADGRTGWEAHNDYPLMWQEVNREVMEAVHADEEAPNNWTFFARSGWASTTRGTGGLSPTMWGGDQNTDWGYDDGYPTVLPIAAHVGLSGVSIFGSDVAGYTSVLAPNTTKELFYRWTTLGAFSPLMRTHHGSDECGNWDFRRDAETVDHYRRYASIHTLLLPFWRGLLAESIDTGLPMIRHPWLVVGDVPAFYNGQDYSYFLGDDVLVAPVLEQGATQRDVVLPGEAWWPLLGDRPIVAVADASGVVATTAVAEATEIPVFVRPGTVLPLLADVVDSFYGATDADTTDLDSLDGRIAAAMYPDQAGEVDGEMHGVSIQLSGWTQDLDWSLASVGADAIASCDDELANVCLTGDGPLLFRADATVTLTDTTLSVTGLGSVSTIQLGVGGDGWSIWRLPTTLTELDPDIPPPCEEP